jgi:hypothetical protein
VPLSLQETSILILEVYLNYTLLIYEHYNDVVSPVCFWSIRYLLFWDKISTPLLLIDTVRSQWGARWPRGQCARRAIDDAKQLSMVNHKMGDQNLLFRAPPCFGRHVKPLVTVAFADSAPIPVSRRVDVRQAAGRKKQLPNLYHNMMKNMLYRSHLVG